MQQQPTYSAALADRSITIVPRPPPTKCQFASVLNHDDITIANMRPRALGRMARHLGDAYPVIAQKAREPHLLGSIACKTPDARARPSNQRLMQRGPLFPGDDRQIVPAQIPSLPPAKPLARPWNQSLLTTATKMCAFDSPR